LSFKEYLGVEGSLLPRLATGFGGGIGRKGSLCGALTGSVMVIGMRFGRTEAEDQTRKDDAYAKSFQFWDRFEKEFGSCDCYGLIGCRLDNPEERRQWLASGGMAKCAGIVEKTCRMLADFLDQGQ